ncbi:hypothetical protein D3C78_1819880 [compost metagenome]
MTLALQLVEAGRPRDWIAASMRGRPARMPYSAQLKLGTSGTVSRPCGGVMMVRGMGWSNGQCSTLMTRCTMILPCPGSARAGGSAENA